MGEKMNLRALYKLSKYFLKYASGCSICGKPPIGKTDRGYINTCFNCSVSLMQSLDPSEVPRYIKYLEQFLPKPKLETEIEKPIEEEKITPEKIIPPNLQKEDLKQYFKNGGVPYIFEMIGLSSKITGLSSAVRALIPPYETIRATEINECTSIDALARLLKHAERECVEAIFNNAHKNGTSIFYELEGWSCTTPLVVEQEGSRVVLRIYANDNLITTKRYPLDIDKIQNANNDQDLIDAGVPEWYIEIKKPKNVKAIIMARVTW